MDTRNIISATEARKRFAEVIDNIDQGSPYYTLTVNGKPKIVMMKNEELESLLETIDILSDTELMKGIQEGLADIKAGRVHSFEEVFGETTAQVLDKN